MPVFPMGNIFPGFEKINLTHHFIDGAEAKFSHDFTQFLHKEAEEIDDVISITRKAFPQVRILGGYSNRTGI